MFLFIIKYLGTWVIITKCRIDLYCFHKVINVWDRLVLTYMITPYTVNPVVHSFRVLFRVFNAAYCL